MRSHYVSTFSSVRVDGENATKTSVYTQSFYENASFSKRIGVARPLVLQNQTIIVWLTII